MYQFLLFITLTCIDLILFAEISCCNSLGSLSSFIHFTEPSSKGSNSHPRMSRVKKLLVPSAFSSRQCAKHQYATVSCLWDTDEKGHTVPYYASYIPSALAALRKATRLAIHLQPEYKTSRSFVSNHTFAKTDASPVTIADFGVQALVLHHLNQSLSNSTDSFVFVAEEGSEVVRQNPTLAHEILHLFNTIPGCYYSTSSYPRIESLEQLITCIDLGKTYDPQSGQITPGTITEKKRLLWSLDPIDGTKGFLRGKQAGGQYCIALALIEEEGSPVLGFLACPNLPVCATDGNFAWSEDESHENIGKSRGCIFVALKGGGCFQLPLFSPLMGTEDADASLDGAKRVYATTNDGTACPIEKVRFSVAVEKGYGDPYGQGIEMARVMHGKLNPENGDILYCDRLDSQAKYGLLARGSSQVFFRLPKAGCVEWIWDHAPGKIILEEAGGLQTDTLGYPLGYGYGARLDPRVKGVLASSGGVIHQSLLKAYNQTQIIMGNQPT